MGPWLSAAASRDRSGMLSVREQRQRERLHSAFNRTFPKVRRVTDTQTQLLLALLILQG